MLHPPMRLRNRPSMLRYGDRGRPLGRCGGCWRALEGVRVGEGVLGLVALVRLLAAVGAR